MSQETGTNDTFNKRINIIIAVVIAVIAVLGSLITKLESEASIAANKASVAEQQYYYEAIGAQIRGQANVNHAFGTVYQLWYQYDVQMMSAKSRGEAEAVKTYAELKDAITKTSSLFDPLYFNAETGKVNLVRYEADKFQRKLYELEEKQLAADETASAWGDKSTTYVLQLTLLAVAGFLLGLALMTKARVSTLVFSTSGILLVFIIGVWAYQVSQTRVIERPTEAITAYAEGASLIDQKLWDEALVKLNEAIEKGNTDTPYGRAYLLRAQIHSEMRNFNEAIADYQVAIASGYTGDPTVDASLVQAFFNEGDFTNAIETGTVAINNSPENLALRQHVNMAILASGDIDTASEQVAILLEKATGKVKQERQLGNDNAAAETWWLLNDAAHQYDQLVELLTDVNAKSPIKDRITDPEAVRNEAEKLASQLRSGAIELKYNITEETDSTLAQIDIKTIKPSWTPDKNYVYKVDLEFQYSGIKENQLLSITTYRNGIEEPSWAFSEPWSGKDAAGTANTTISPSYSSLYIVPPGSYTVYMYLNNTLLAQDTFDIEDPNNQLANAPTDGTFAFGSMLDQFDFFTSDFIYGDFENYDWSYDDWYYNDWSYYYYDPYFFYDSETDYTYFLDGAYDPYSDYCSDPNDLSCFTSNDSDGDGVPDEFDYCVDEPGSWDFDGCPYSEEDADGDGINDFDDPCPYDYNNDCLSSEEDTDGDGTPDVYDSCPDDPFDECLGDIDTDGDGTPDSYDSCPNDPFDECLGDVDSDGDGTPDSYDSCPNDPYDECIDSDGDGTPDVYDSCPDDPYDECIDSDGDGTPDVYDSCPDDPYDECIDSDGDGTPDVNDPCPDDPYDECIYGIFDFKNYRQRLYSFSYEPNILVDSFADRVALPSKLIF